MDSQNSLVAADQNRWHYQLMPRPFQPDWLSPPGHTIADAMLEMNLSELTMQTALGLSTEACALLLEGKYAITEPLARALEQTLGEPAEFWLKREGDFRRADA